MAVIEKLTDFAKRMAGARTAVQELHQHEAALQREHAELEQERSRLINAKPPREELIANLDGQVRALGEQWTAANGGRVVSALAGALEVSPRGEITGIRPGALAAEFGGPLDLAMLAALAPAFVRDAFAAIVETVEYEAGPAMAARPRLVAEVDAKRARVEREHRELVDTAAAAGLTLEHMPGERARRVQAAQQRDAAMQFNLANRTAIKHGYVKPAE